MKNAGWLALLAIWLAHTTSWLAHEGRAEERRAIFDGNDAAVTFKLRDKNGKTPRLVLFDAPDQAGTAESINFWRGTQDTQEEGVPVEFKAIRFFRSKDKPDELGVRLVGIQNELELGDAISLPQLESGKLQRLHFGPATMGPGLISGTTEADMAVRYNPQNRTLEIPEVAGQLEWKRPFYEAQSDRGSLEDVKGEVGQVPAGGRILKPAEK